MIAILNVSGERTTGTWPYYGVVDTLLADSATDDEILAARDQLASGLGTSPQNHHDVAIGRVSDDALQGARVKYVPA